MHWAFTELATNHIVTLTEMLDCRESRQSRQHAWLAYYQVSLISLTIVTPGIVKDMPITRQAFNLAWRAIHQLCMHNNWQPIAETVSLLPTGPEALMVIDINAFDLKQAMIELEQSCAIGRLWDIDVFDKDGTLLSRQAYGFPARQCLVCHQNAKVCSRNRQHTSQELLAAMQSLVYHAQDSDEN